MDVPILATHPTELILAVTTEHAVASTAFFNAVRTLGTFTGVGYDPLGRTSIFPGVLLPQKNPVAEHRPVVRIQVTSETK